MLLKSKYPRSCSYCKYGTKLQEDTVLCTKHGVVSPATSCRRFTYDPCKRIPLKTKAPDFQKYSDEDFSL